MPADTNSAANEPLDLNELNLEIGQTGLQESSGYVYEEWHSRLRGQRGVRVYKEMRDNNAVVGAVLFLIESLILKVDWSAKAANDSAQAQEAKELLDSAMTDMSHSWEDMISEILSMLPFGWAYFEIVYKQRQGLKSSGASSRHSDNKIGWRKISLRSQETLDRWLFDDSGGIRGMVQSVGNVGVSGSPVFIPMQKSLLFRTRSHKNNPEGRSMLRNAYRSWYFLKRVQEIEAIGIERDLAGLPVLEVPPALMDPNAPAGLKTMRRNLENLVAQIRRDEREGVLIPAEEDERGRKTGYRLRLLSTGGNRAIDVNAAIVRYEQRIAMTVLAQFILMGMENTGSFALADSATNVFSMALEAVLKRIKSVFDRFAIPRLMVLNGISEEFWPTITYSDFEDLSLNTIAAYVNQLVGANVLTPDEDLESWARRQVDMPVRDQTVPRNTGAVTSQGALDE